MRIAILHECYLKKPHLARLKKLGKVTLYKETWSENLAIKRLKNIDVAVIHCSLLPITKKILKGVNKLKYISLASTGYDRIDLNAAKSLNIVVSNLPTYGTESVAEHAIGLMLTLLRRIVRLDREFRRKPYEINFLPNNKSLPFRAMNLRGKTLGVIGTGKIGERVAQIANAFGMSILGYDKFPRNIQNVQMVPFKKLLKESDIISLHTPFDRVTKRMIGENELSLMKPNSIIINTARSGLIDEKALHETLKNKTIAGAGLDMVEKMNKSNPLLKLQNVIFTPHSAWYSDESCNNIADIVTSNIEAFTQGAPINVIS